MRNIYIEEQLRALSKRIAEDQVLDQKTPTQILLTTTARTQDEATIDREDVFKHRFGFSKPKEQRRHFIYLKNQLDLTDKEVTVLHSSRMAKFNTGSKSTVESNGILFILGLFVFISILLVLTLISLLAITSLSFDFYKTAYATSALIFLTIGAWHTHENTITPIKILMSRGVFIGKKLVLNGTSFKYP